jgi:hypothetical protein
MDQTAIVDSYSWETPFGEDGKVAFKSFKPHPPVGTLFELFGIPFHMLEFVV